MAWIRHPRIDDGLRVIEVADESLPHHYRAGWEVTDPPPEPPPLDEDEPIEAPETPGLSHVQDQPPRRPRTKQKEAD